jgi:hypothetical protein
VQGLIDAVGEDNVLLETDFPHPTCLYPSPLDTIENKMLTLRPETRRKVLGGMRRSSTAYRATDQRGRVTPRPSLLRTPTSILRPSATPLGAQV